ncbi:hypothetical protein AB1Y20_005454 [Prymnesium parvum]|uniref:Peptidase A1 domain-containing protein n=1 Tax=Prymnesium parvum TaxID=97485 RepID=A0AB34J6J4_PRYPA
MLLPFAAAALVASRTAQDATHLLASDGGSSPLQPATDSSRPRLREVLPHRRLARAAEELSEAPADAQPGCVVARNFMNTQYTVSIAVDGQSFWAVPDTGSFELLVPSSNCSQCTACEGNAKTTFPETDVHARSVRSHRVDIAFGQGNVVTRTVNAPVQVGGLSAPTQSLLLLEEINLSHYCDSSYDGVMGLGCRRNARDEDLEPSLLASMGIDDFSLCFGRYDADPGRLILGGGILGLQYSHVPVVGQRHWAVQLVGAAFASPSDAGRSGERTRSLTGALCATPPYCSAIVDSGTSLIAGPRQLVYALIDALHPQLEEDCSNVDQLPELEFAVGPPGASLPLRLSPEFYVLRTESTDADTDLPADPPAAPSAPPRQRCSLMFMELDMQDHTFGPVWILGAPFMRAYSTLFSRGEDGPTGGSVSPNPPAAARQIGFARIPNATNPCAGCPGSRGTSALAEASARGEVAGPPSVSLRHARLSLLAKWGSRAANTPAHIL